MAAAARRFSAREWAGRLALALFAAVLAVLSVKDALANVIAKVDPATAHRLSPDNALISAKQAKARFAIGELATGESEPERLAREALRRDPTVTDGLTVLGLGAQLREDPVLSQQIFSYSLQLSRRELQARIWAVEDAVDRGDIKTAIDNYDIALRTSKSAPDLFFPTLGSALSEPMVRKALLQKLAGQPVWEKRFVDHVASNSRDPDAAIAFYSGRRAVRPAGKRRQPGGTGTRPVRSWKI